MLQLLFLTLLIAHPPAIQIDIWVNKEQPIYYPDESLEIFFQVDQDCYLAIYNVEQGGRETLLFPLDGAAGWVEAGRIYQLPADSAGYDYLISESPGVERILGLASTERLPTFYDEEDGVAKATYEILIKEQEPAKLRLLTTPRGSKIYITNSDNGDEEFVGKTPQILVLKPGEYTVKITKSGYHTLTRTICLEAGAHRRVFANLTRY